MLDAALIHLKYTKNTGDLACSPHAYFDFGTQSSFGFKDTIPACDLAIIGGGQVFQKCVDSCIYQVPHAKHRVIWGVGISPKDTSGLDYELAKASCSLISTRNWGVEVDDYVPCPSAMSPLFDAPATPQHEVVLFTHAKKSDTLPRDPAIPEMTNHQGTMADAIAFLASGATVVTNSFHGTFWAMCLGRKVLCVPFNRKFHFFRENPVMATPQDWMSRIQTAETRDDTLRDARDRNQRFYEKVRNLL